MKLGFILIFMAYTTLGFGKSFSEKLPPIQMLDTLPELNNKIIGFVKENKHKRVGRGEC